MISEPELIGAFGPDRTAEAVGGFDSDRKPPTGTARGRGRGLLWAAAGALTASALWAAAVFAYGIGPAPRPDTHGYHLDARSCSTMRMTALTASVGERADAPGLVPGSIEHPALDTIECSMTLTAPKSSEDGYGWRYGLHVGLEAELHKETDPLPEFEARKEETRWGDGADRVEPVPGLGDRAYLLAVDESSSELRVVEGGAVITLTLSTTMDYAGSDEGREPPPVEPETPAAEPYHADLITDMREVMAQLKAG
ncbi:hypothetical protein ACMZ5F_16890 [Streptomyces rhizosphaericola]|uniref:hypothetical protein n=1 Tax=Streptomyces rhizosphaericola TaxID=2564098 RepID=UPI0039F05239